MAFSTLVSLVALVGLNAGVGGAQELRDCGGAYYSAEKVRALMRIAI